MSQTLRPHRDATREADREHAAAIVALDEARRKVNLAKSESDDRRAEFAEKLREVGGRAAEPLGAAVVLFEADADGRGYTESLIPHLDSEIHPTQAPTGADEAR